MEESQSRFSRRAYKRGKFRELVEERAIEKVAETERKMLFQKGGLEN